MSSTVTARRFLRSYLEEYMTSRKLLFWFYLLLVLLKTHCFLSRIFSLASENLAVSKCIYIPYCLSLLSKVSISKPSPIIDLCSSSWYKCKLYIYQNIIQSNYILNYINQCWYRIICTQATIQELVTWLILLINLIFYFSFNFYWKQKAILGYDWIFFFVIHPISSFFGMCSSAPSFKGIDKD